MNRALIAVAASTILGGCATMPDWAPFASPAHTTTVGAADVASSQTPWASGPQPGSPHLIVTIVVDQFSATLFNQYRGRLTGGLHTLSEQGRVYQSGYQSHAITETCPGHSTVLTGASPWRTGIPANNWMDRETGGRHYCLASSVNTLAHGRDTDNGPVGPEQLSVTTLGDWLKGVSPDSRVFAVSGKDRGAINLAGHQGRAFWLTEGFGFTTYVEPGQDAAERLQPVAAFNARLAPRLAQAPTWTYTSEACRALEGDWVVGGQPFHATVPPADLEFDTSPLEDEVTLEAAADLLETQQLGRRGVVDMLGVSLSATDHIGHSYGQQGPEMCEQMHRLDAALGAFLDQLSRVPGGVLVVLTADHGGSDFAERMAAQGQPAARRSDPEALARLNAEMKARFGLSADPLAPGGSGLMVVGQGGVPMTDTALRERIAAAVVERVRADPRYAGAWTLGEVLASPPPPADLSPQEYTLLQRERLSAVAGRSADILLVSNPGTSGRGRVGGSIASHGSPWDYDRRVPIVFWSPGVTVGQERPLAIRTVDIAPTVANVIGVTPAATVEGRCLDLGLFADAPACPAP